MMEPSRTVAVATIGRVHIRAFETLLRVNEIPYSTAPGILDSVFTFYPTREESEFLESWIQVVKEDQAEMRARREREANAKSKTDIALAVAGWILLAAFVIFIVTLLGYGVVSILTGHAERLSQ